MENPVETQADAFDSARLSMAQPPAVEPQRALGEYLRLRREADEMSLEEITRTTKIPKASLLHLEAGRFDKLPGDVFVRGFLRSYARCLKLDGDDVVSRYAQCGLNPAPVSSEMAETLLAQKTSSTTARRPKRFPHATRSPQAAAAAAETESLKPSSPETDPSETSTGVVKAELAKSESVRNVLRDAFDLRNWQRSPAKEKQAALPAEEVEVEVVKPERSRNFVPPRLDFNDEMSHRGPLTLGVIILVIVATLTMSYLLRRPGTSVDGFTMAPAADGQPALIVDGTQSA
jgi:hypothetical protein